MNVLVDGEALAGAGLFEYNAHSRSQMLDRAEARKVAEAVWDYVLALIGLELLYIRRFRDQPPGRFAALLRPDIEAETLTTLEGWHTILVEAEVVAETTATSRRLWQRCCGQNVCGLEKYYVVWMRPSGKRRPSTSSLSYWTRPSHRKRQNRWRTGGTFCATSAGTGSEVRRAI